MPWSTTARALRVQSIVAVARRPARRLYATAALSSQGHENSDIVIVGGGPIGLALASALGSSQVIRDTIRVTLVEAGDLSKVRNWSPAPGTYSNRVSSLTNSSQRFLQDLGAWNDVEMERTYPIEDMQVWDGISDARIMFHASDLGLQAAEPAQMAHLTENLNLQRALLRHLDRIPQIRVLDKTKVQGIVRDNENGHWPLVHLENGTVLRARLLVGADGLNSPVRSYAKIASYGWAYDTQAIVATMFHPPKGAFLGPNTTAYQRFLPTGPIAFLPLSTTVSSLVWSTKPDLASALLAVESPVLVHMINAAFRLPELSIQYLHNCILKAHFTGTPITPEQIRAEILFREGSHAIDQHSAYASAVSETSGVPPADAELLPPVVTSLQPESIASFPLRFNHSESYLGEGTGDRTVLVGDAAHTIHPLAGQGLNMGLADVECLSRCIQNTIQQGGDIGSYTALLPYSQERYIENHIIMSAVDKLHKLYSSTLEPVVWARSVGVEILNELDSIKAAIMTIAGSGSHRFANSNGRSALSSAGWNMAGTGIGTLSATVNAVKTLGAGVLGMIGSQMTSTHPPKSNSER